MDINAILYPVLSLGVMSVIFGFGLGYAGLKFKVEEDPSLTAIKGVLPGANCGGCGYAGCGAFAEAVFNKEAQPNGCPVGGAKCAAEIGEILGISVEMPVKMTAFIKCSGSMSKSISRYTYQGIDSCPAAMQLTGGGAKKCVYGCLGGGSCTAVCQFGAVENHDGVAYINTEKCTACGKCVSACPKNIIVMVPYDKKVKVACASPDKPKTVRESCSVGCLGCKLCEKACNSDAIHVNNFLAEIDYSKCTQCGDCVKKCPASAISL